MFENLTANLNEHRTSCAKIVCLSQLIFTIIYSGSSIQKCEPEIRLVYAAFFYKRRSYSDPTEKKSNASEKKDGWNVCARFKQICFDNDLELHSCSYNFYPHNDRYYHLPNYWPFLLNHPVYLKSAFFAAPDYKVFATECWCLFDLLFTTTK